MATGDSPIFGYAISASNDVQQKAVAAYTEKLQSAMTPLSDRYNKALRHLTETQQGYTQEVGRRITAAYQNFTETLSVLPAGSAQLEPTIDAYNALLQKYADYADPSRWQSILAPTQQKMEEAVADAHAADDPNAATQRAVSAYYKDLTDTLADDHIVQDLTDAQALYLTEMVGLHADIEQNWQSATETINADFAAAATETAAAFDVNAALEAFMKEIREISDAMSQAYEDAGAAAKKAWADGTSDDGGSAKKAGRQTTTSATSALVKKPDPASAAKAMAVGTATMPRASWVNVPDPTPDDTNAEKGNKAPPKNKPAAKSGKARSRTKAEPAKPATASKADDDDKKPGKAADD